MKKGLIIVAAAFACALGASAASFTNLNFEAYMGPEHPGSDVNVLPGWERSTGGYRWPMFDDLPLVTSGLGLSSTNGSTEGGCYAALAGRYSAFFSSGNIEVCFEGGGCYWDCCGFPTIWQTAQVPTNAVHIRYSSSPTCIKEPDGGGHYEIRIQGTLGSIDLSASTPEALSNGTLRYTTDIGSLAGQTVQLSFGLVGEDYFKLPGSWHWLDQIEFLDGEGNVLWPLPPPVCLEDFHAGTLNTSRWEVATVGQEISYSTTNGDLQTRIGFGADTAATETTFRFRPLMRGDWDVLLDFRTYQITGTGTGTVGMALGADFGPDGAAKAGVGRMADIRATEPRYMVDWGAGPAGEVSNAPVSGIFRLIRAGEEVTGLIWSAESNRWQTIGAASGYTDESARIGIKVWNTGMLGGKGSFETHADNLMLVDGKMSLEGMAIKVFGLDENGAPTMAWDSAEIAENSRYFVTRSTNLLDPVWNRVSGGILDSGGETNWADSAPGSGSFFYRIEAAPK